MTHTPGPWAHKEQEIFAADGTCICYVRYNGEEGDPESQDTARLIAAAPDLLEALEAFDVWVEEDRETIVGHSFRKRAADVIEKARAAIAKAKP